MDGDQLQNHGASQRRQPSRMASPKKLSELSASANNARQQISMLPPPQVGMKRKTLAERAGEAPRTAPAPPGSRLIPPSVKATSIAASVHPPGCNSSIHTRSMSSASRNGANPFPPGTSYRSQTAMSNHSKSRSIHGLARPASSFDHAASTIGKGPASGTANSMDNISFRECFATSSRRKTPHLDSRCGLLDGSGDIKDMSCSLFERPAPRTLRDISLSAAMGSLSLAPIPSILPALERGDDAPVTPSQLPKLNASMVSCRSFHARPSRSPKKSPSKGARFLNKDSNVMMPDWDLGSRVENMESMYADLKASMSTTTAESNGLKESLALYKARVNELEEMRGKGVQENAALQAEIQQFKMEISSLSTSLDDWKRKYSGEIQSSSKAAEDSRRVHKDEVEDLKRQHRREVNEARDDAEQAARQKDRVHNEELDEFKRKLETAVEEEKERRRKEVKDVSSESAMAQQKLEGIMEAKEREIRALQEDMERSKRETAQERDNCRELRSKLSDSASLAAHTEAGMRSLKARIEFLESDSKSQSQAFTDLEQQAQDAIKEADETRAKLRIEETLRRKLHNQVQELKGNIRVFCRVRPTLEIEDSDQARMMFPDAAEDSKELEVLGPEEKSSLGKITTKKNAFNFDRVFDPRADNGAVFDEISQLVQSALDGYNVCIFCYGQTGSGKTYTMSSDDGMIPRAVHQIYETAQSLQEKGWRYSMSGSFVEVYNENINDLLGKAEDFDKKKHEIRHDMESCKTTITDVAEINLDSPGQVEAVLRKAMSNRSVAATKANERSSRSHSVFILRLYGENDITGEKSEGTLNLVDLAGSERLSQSGATGDRLRETQSINKSLSCLGDVIGALGQGKDGAHIPYRNSKLTYLLQFSLGGNSKTLMFVMVSPFQAHLGETLTSLKFATKVHNTHIGTAKRQTKVQT